MNVDEQVREELQAHADQVVVEMPPAEHVLRRAGQRTVRTSVTTLVGFSAVVAVAAWLIGWPAPTLDVADSPPSRTGMQVIEPELLDGTRLRLTLPSDVVADADQLLWAGSLYAADTLGHVGPTTAGWRVEVRRGALNEVMPGGRDLELPSSAAADAARLQPEPALGLAFGPWVATISGDRLTDEDVDLLLEVVDLAETPGGNVEYVGSLPLWVVDSPDLLLSSPATAVSIFLRSCTSPSTNRTAGGLSVSRGDDPNRGGHLAVLCTSDLPIEIWLDTEQPIDDATLDLVEVDVIRSGSILTVRDADPLGSSLEPSGAAATCPSIDAPAYEGVPAGWEPLPPPPFTRRGAAAVWTGQQLLYVGGDTGFGGAEHDNVAAYDPTTGGWSCRTTAPFLVQEFNVAWTGQLLYAWDGTLAVTYDPARYTWRQLPRTSAAKAPVVVSWTGEELIVWGSRSRGAGSSPSGVAYDPIADRWRQLPDAPISINQGQGVWTGTELIIFGSQLDGNNNSTTSTAVGAAYDPAADRWRQLPPALSPQASSIIWTGDELIAWDYELTARAYDPRTDSWSNLPDLPLEFSECYPDTALLDSGAVFAWFCGQAALLDPESRSWTELDTPITTHLGRPASDTEVDQITGTPTAAGQAIYFAGTDGLWRWTPTQSD